MGLFNFKKKKEETKAAALVAQTKETDNPSARPFVEGLVSTKDIIAPSALEVDFDWIRIDNKYHRTLFVAGYPRFVGINWLSPLINFDASLNISMYIYPTDGKEILDDLRRKIAEMEAEISTDIQRGRVVNPATQAKLEDALTLQADLVKGEERFFQYGLYVTISSHSKDDLNRITKNIEAALGALMIVTKKATLQMEEGFVSTLPLCSDQLKITRNMDTTSLATTFPFVSSDLSDDKGIMYGINEHNGSLIIFDRFSMPNYNSVVFASAGAGKSYMIKLEAMRSLMLGCDIIVIDPENEYRALCEAVGGQYIAFGYGEESKINPFDLSLVEEEGENALNSKMLNLHKLFKVMIGEMDPMDESILDRAIMDAYKMKGITPDPETQSKEAPLIEDLYKSLIGMEDPKAQMLAARFEKYIKGSFAGIFNQKTTVNLNNNFVVFGIRNLEEALRPVAMHIILDYIWTVVKKTLRKRILIVDEAWYMMQYPDSASFLRGIVKRGRKYYLGVTTITQDVDDFLETPFGKEIVTNSSIQILLKQHSAAIEQVGEVFYLSEGEKQLLLSADKGEGIFFAGQNHVAIRVIASEDEHKLITSNPEEVLKMKQQGKLQALTTNISTTTNPQSQSIKQDMAQKLPTPAANTQTASTTNIQATIIKKDEPISEVAETVVNTPQAVSSNPLLEKKQKIEVPISDNINVNPVIKFTEPSSENTSQKSESVEKAVTDSKTNNQIPTELKSEGAATEELLSQKISILEAEANKELEAHEVKLKQEEEEKKKQEEEKAKMMGSFGGGLPKYQDLFKAFPASDSGQALLSGSGKLPPLPPLPPLPKYEPKKTTNDQLSVNSDKGKTNNNSVFSNQTQATSNDEVPKPTAAINTSQAPTPTRPFAEVKAETVTNQSTSNKAQITNDKKTEDKNNGKTYEDLFGNGIV